MAVSISRTFRVAVGGFLLSLNTLVHVTPLVAVALPKALLRLPAARRLFDGWLIAIAESWIGINSIMFDRLTSTRLVVDGLPEPDSDAHMLVICNHQSWADIPVLQKLFNRRLPLLRFFLKSQLIWVPLLGLAWWALDFPFLKRYSKEILARRPKLAGRDLETTRRACRKFREIPVAVMSFVEGTRFSPAKRDAAGSPYAHLLKPRAGGVGLVLEAMGDIIDTVVDVTIVYSEPAPTLADLFADRIRLIRVAVRTVPVPKALRRPANLSDEEYRERVRRWINELWHEKDRRIADLRREIARGD